jgi:formylglycine-generating enzyme required for sulfatase activity
VNHSTTSLLVCLALCGGVYAPVLAVSIDTVPVGDPGNSRAPTYPYGNVDHAYRIGTYEITNLQYAEFLNAKAKSDPLGLYSASMSSDPRGGITRSGNSGNFAYATKTNMGNKPVNFVSWYDALRFVNWVNNGQGNGETETGAYTLGGLDASGVPISGSSIARNPAAKWFLPSEHEWFKAAFYQPAEKGGDTDSYWLYPTASNSAPTVATANNVGDISNPGANVANYSNGADWNGQDGNVTTVGSAGPLSRSYYGTFDQGGNVYEWSEAVFYYEVGAGVFLDTDRVSRGGSYATSMQYIQQSLRTHAPSEWELGVIGFRVATVPEPSTLALAALGALGLLTAARRRR